MLQILLLFLLVQELVRRLAAGLADPTLVEAPLLMKSALLLVPALLLKPVPLLVPILVDVMMMLRNWLVRRLVGRLADPTLEEARLWVPPLLLIPALLLHQRTRQRQRLAQDGPRPALLNSHEARRMIQKRGGAGVRLLHRLLDEERWRVVRQMGHYWRHPTPASGPTASDPAPALARVRVRHLKFSMLTLKTGWVTS